MGWCDWSIDFVKMSLLRNVRVPSIALGLDLDFGVVQLGQEYILIDGCRRFA